MKGKKEILILAAAIGILSLYLAWRQTDQENYRLPELPALAQADVSRLEITGPKGPLTLSLKDDQWQIDPKGYKADPEKVRQMLGALDELALTAMVSESRSYGRYGLSPEKQISVKAWAGDQPVRELLIGRTADSYRQTFVMLAGDQRVYHAQGDIRRTFDWSADGLRDKTVLAFEKKEIEGLTLDRGSRSLDLRRVAAAAEKGDDPGGASEAGKVSWQTAEGKNFDGSKVDELLGSVENLHCSAFFEGKKEDMKKPLCRLSLAGQKEYGLSIYAPRDKTKGYPAISSQSDSPFLLPAAEAESILKLMDELDR
jgi:hypothetical protein